MKFQKQYTVLCGLLSCKNKEQNKHKSSYWSRKTKNFYTDKQTGVTGLSAIGKYSRNRVLSRIYHYLFQRLIFSFSNKIFSSPWYKLSKQCAEQQNRSVDMDILRHVFTFDLLDRYIFKKQKINNVCVIGDGQSNFVSPAIRSNRFNKVVSVNIEEVLLNDIFLIEKENLLEEEEVAIVTNDENLQVFLNDNHTKLILIPAQKSKILTNIGIELFVNIASFQEMSVSVIKNYFEIIKSNNAYLYTFNREYKKLPGGEVLEFSKYPWDISGGGYL
ncbi:hypothetical protein HOL24_04075 [bacterium]|nr:hypothetical protein [bacterium]